MGITHIISIIFGMASIRWVALMLTAKQIEFVFEWASTIILLCGAYLTSINVYPLNVYLSMVGNLGWLVVALCWRKWSLIIIQLVITVIYISGLISSKEIVF